MLTAFGYPMIVCLVYLFIVGTVVGSFLNVCIYRIPTKDRLLDSLRAIVSPKSRCPKCGNGIPIWFNVPVLGWIVTGLICAAGGFVWIKVLDNSKKKQVVDVCIAMYYKTLGRFRFQ